MKFKFCYWVVITYLFSSCNSLFAIPANQEYVYMNNVPDVNTDRLAFAVNNLIKSCHPGGQETISFPFSCQPEAHSRGRSFHKFLKVHIDLAFSKGFDDNVGTGRHSSHPIAYFEVLITLSKHFKYYYNFIKNNWS